MPTALLIANRDKPEAARTAAAIRPVIARHAQVLDVDAGDQPLSEGTAFDLAFVVGGDGTLIGQTRRLEAFGRPIVGINAGRLGFLAEFDAGDLERHADLVFAATPPLRARMLLAVEVIHADGAPSARGLAINDAVLTAGAPHRMIDMVLSVDDRFLFTGDHLDFDSDRRRLSASRDYCWYSWPKQTESMRELLKVRFEWVLPGHGRRVWLPADEMRTQLERLIAEMETTPARR